MEWIIGGLIIWNLVLTAQIYGLQKLLKQTILGLVGVMKYVDKSSGQEVTKKLQDLENQLRSYLDQHD